MTETESLQKEKVSIDLVWANIFSILLLFPIGIVFGLPYYLIWVHNKIDAKSIISGTQPEDLAIGGFSICIMIVVGIVFHELIHGISWAKFTKHGFKSITFGVLWKMLTPYCHCKEPLRIKHYIIGAITPALFLGFLPSVVAILIGNFYLLFFGMFFTVAAAGDFLVINLLRKEKMDDFVQDHPSEAGCYVYRK